MSVTSQVLMSALNGAATCQPVCVLNSAPGHTSEASICNIDHGQMAGMVWNIPQFNNWLVRILPRLELGATILGEFLLPAPQDGWQLVHTVVG